MPAHVIEFIIISDSICIIIFTYVYSLVRDMKVRFDHYQILLNIEKFPFVNVRFKFFRFFGKFKI